MSMSAYLVYGGGTPGQTVFHQVNSGGTPGPGQPVFHRLNRLEVNGGGSSVSFLILIVLCFSEYFVFVNVFYIKGCIRFFSFFLVLFFCLFSTTFPSSFFFPDWPTRFLQLTKGAITLFYDKQLCYTTTTHFFCYKQLRGTVTLSYGKQVPRQIIGLYFASLRNTFQNSTTTNCITSFLSAE